MHARSSPHEIIFHPFSASIAFKLHPEGILLENALGVLLLKLLTA